MGSEDKVDIGRVGVWTFQLEQVPATRAQELTAELDELGYGAVWIPETAGREAFTHAGLLLAGSSRITVATGIAGIWGRDPLTAASAHKTLSEAYPGRFLLGLGVSHQVAVEGLHGQRYAKPYTAMREYLERMDGAPYFGVEPSVRPRRVLAALGPKMLALAADHADGALPYNVPIDHTPVARAALGPDRLLAVELAVVLATDAEQARALGRRHLSLYLGLPNYTDNLRRFGFGDDDLADGGSDRLVDALVAWGDEAAIARRVAEHHDAGADHVCIQVIPDAFREPPIDAWRRLAPALLG